MSDSVDDFNSQGGGGEHPYDNQALNLPKLISKQNNQKIGARDWYEMSQSSIGGPPQATSHSQLSYGRMPFNQTQVDLMIKDGMLRQEMGMNSEIQKTINILRKDPKLLNQVQSQLSLYQEDRIKKSYDDGVKATQMAKARVRESVRRTNLEEEQGIENLI